MYSNSQSYLGGVNTSRLGEAQQSSFVNNGQYGKSSTAPFAGLQSQYTGMPMQAQQTGYTGIQQGQLAPQHMPLYTGMSSPFQNTQQQQQSAPISSYIAAQSSTPATQVPMKTGMTSNQMADSFRSTSSPVNTTVTSNKSNRFPNIRLSFITATDQAKFEELFKSAAGKDHALSGDQAREILLRSRLSGDSLAEIWTLADTTKSGQLLFPEFALAMYLCSLKLNGSVLPNKLPERITNEVSSMVDIISFGAADISNSNSKTNNTSHKTQQSPTNDQLLSQLQGQPTGYMQPQLTAYQPQQTGFGQIPQMTGFGNTPGPMSVTPTGYGNNQGLSIQPTGYNTMTLLNAQPTGSNSTTSLNAQPTGYNPITSLNAQPTGRAGQWGLVNAPVTGLPGLQEMQRQMMPQPGREQGFSAVGLQGNATVPWAVTKDEKKIYDEMFKAWDGFGKGFITGNQAIEIFSQSGLDRTDLERIWTLSDPQNKGKLNIDEYAIAMHLIYRRLNGYPVPNQLPPELVPPSTRTINDSIGTMKSLLYKDAQQRKETGAFLQPQQTGVSYLKNHSFQNGNDNFGGRKDATVYKNDDNSGGYRSNARRRTGNDGRASSPDVQSFDSTERIGNDMNTEQLTKLIREKQVLLDAMDFEDENVNEQEDALDRRDRKEADELYRRIRRFQEDIDKHPKSAYKSSNSDAERRSLQRQLRNLSDRLPALASHARKCERAISDAQLELFRLRDTRNNPSSSPAIVGTGPGGEVTESDRLKARAKAMMQQRSAALTGKSIPQGSDDGSSAAKRLEQETSRVRREREDNEKMVREVEESVADFAKSIEHSLKEGVEHSKSEHERRRWEDGLGVEDEIKDFIMDLQRNSRNSVVRREDGSKKEEITRSNDTSNMNSSRDQQETRNTTTSTMTSSSTNAPAAGSYSTYKTAEERAAFVKQQAEIRMAERLAALGLKVPSKSGESIQQKQERERKEREDRLRVAEQEDAKREEERQQRLADESISPPASKPASPVSKSRNLSTDSPQSNIANQQTIQKEEIDQLQRDVQNPEDELKREQEEAKRKLEELEERVRQGKMKKDEEKRKKKEMSKENKEKESRLASQRAEIEAAKEKERQLQLQLESLEAEDSSSSSDEEEKKSAINSTEEEIKTKVEDVNMSVAPPTMIRAPASDNGLPSAGTSSKTIVDTSKNPFFKSMAQTSTTTTTATTDAGSSNNPFHRQMTNNNENNKSETALPPPTTTISNKNRSRVKDEDDWSVLDESSSSSDDDDDNDKNKTGGGSAKHLASILFGTMAPPKPLSASHTGGYNNNNNNNNSNSPTQTGSNDKISSLSGSTTMPGSFSPPLSSVNDAPPPAPPMMPTGNAPPPPPMMPSGNAPPPPPIPNSNASSGTPNISGLLGQIQAGKGLKKVETKDKSQSSVAGRVLD